MFFLEKKGKKRIKEENNTTLLWKIDDFQKIQVSKSKVNFEDFII